MSCEINAAQHVNGHLNGEAGAHFAASEETNPRTCAWCTTQQARPAAECTPSRDCAATKG